MHVSLMFSESEKLRMRRANSTSTSTPTPDALVHVKRTLHLFLRAAAGVNPDGKAPEKVFGLFDTSRQVAYLYIVVARMCLDVGSHTVVADAFVALSTPAVRAALAVALHNGRGQPRNPHDTTIRYISTDADETATWFHLLPRLTERCRTWSHKTTCAYRTSKHHHFKSEGGSLGGGWGSQSPLCTCGRGIGTEVLPPQFKPVTPYLTRTAFSPLFSVPYLKEVDVPVDNTVRTGTGTGTCQKNVIVGCRCRSCGKEGGLRCGRCKRVRYCSEVCQRADRKVHKKDCGSVLEAVCGLDLALGHA